ncbi:TraQ conjugal transfer family protein, partial [Flavobacterium hydatis]
MISTATLLSCNKEELEIQHEFPFEVNVMPVPKDVANGDTVE